MDFGFQGNGNRMNHYGDGTFLSVRGTIVSIEGTRIGNRRADGCLLYVGVEDGNGSLVNFLLAPAAYVVDYITLREGMEATFYYRADAPVPLIYPPQYTAVVVAPEQNGVMVHVGYYNNSMISDDMSLQLNMDNSVAVVTTNNQIFLGNPANHELVVLYSSSTRSLPAQTTPMKVVVLCGQ